MKLRADAERNRAAIVAAARTVFAEQGVDAPLDEIAKLAGIGNATLYRRFPTRAGLVAAVFAEQMAAHVRAVEDALEMADAWDGFSSYVQAITQMQARDRGIADLVTMNVSAAPEIEQLRTRAYQATVALVQRARAAGALRSDFTDQDVVLLLMANAGLVERAHGISASASARLIGLLLDGLRASAATTSTPAAPEPEAVIAAMRHNGRCHLGPDPTGTTG